MKNRSILAVVLAVVVLVTGTTLGSAHTSNGSMTAATSNEILGTGFTYQGYLEDSGGPVTATCDFQFSLFESAGDADQVGSSQTFSGVTVSNGYFTVNDLDFGEGAIQGDQRYLQISVRCPAGTGGYTDLSPRQMVQPAPYALALPGLWTQPGSPSPNLIGGYSGNIVQEGVWGATIGGGGEQYWGPNVVADHYGTIGGGVNNWVGNQLGSLDISDLATVGGGANNSAHAWASTVSGGISNTITITSAAGTIGGGLGNTILGEYHNTIGGGAYNLTSGSWNATVAGGSQNQATESEATVGGGAENIASGEFSTISGGYQNEASGHGASIPGGIGNQASGDTSFAGGSNANAAHNGTFVWADSTGAGMSSTADDQFNVYASGGVNFDTGGAPFLVNGASPTSSYANVVVVAKSGGDFTSIQAAIDSIDDASASNPYLVWVAPGVYTETVTMKEHVDLEGAGENLTKITYWGSDNNNDATLHGADSTELRSLSVENTGGDTYAYAIINDTITTTLSHVSVIVSGGISETIGMNNLNSEIRIDHSDFLGLAEHETLIGIKHKYGSLEISNSESSIVGENNWGYLFGIFVQNSTCSLNNLRLSTSEGYEPIGISILNSDCKINVAYINIIDGEYIDGVEITDSSVVILGSNISISANYANGIFADNSYLTLNDSTIDVTEDFGGLRGIYVLNDNDISINNSQITALEYTIYLEWPNTSIVKVGSSLLSGGEVVGSDNVECVGVYDETYATVYTGSCP